MINRSSTEREVDVTRHSSAVRSVALMWLAAMAVLLLVFAAFEGLGVSVLREPSARLRQQTAAAALIGVSLLIVDALLPVASSVVMVALGSLFGVLGGTVLSTVGGMGSLVLAAALGRRGRVPLDRALGDDRRRAAALLNRYGPAAVIASRPIPVVAESTAIMAGAIGMGWGRLLLAGLAGILPVSLIYAIAGDRGSQADGLVVATVLIVLAVAALVLPAAGRRLSRSRRRRAQGG
ncbi:MAG: VTT domain-containing protein [Actinomycetota bacterium]|nr:VTT domain-containing protein [Actinomycetota bacterium]